MDRFLSSFFNLEVAGAYWPDLARGFVVTIALSIATIGLGLLIGCATAMLRAATGRATNFVVIQVVDLLRAIPPLALIVVTYFALPFVGLTMPGFVAAWLTLSLILAAFVSEIVYGGLAAVDRGQWDAARALGLHFPHILVLIALPQALRMTAAPLTNRTIAIAKNTALASVIAVPELLSQATSAQAASANTTPLTMAAFAFLAMFVPLVALARWIERRFPQRRAGDA